MEKESIDQFFKLYHIYQWNSDVDEKVCVEIFFTKFPSPWIEMFINEYVPGDPDNVGRMMSFVKQKLAEWCGQAILQKNYKRLRRMNKYSPLEACRMVQPTIFQPSLEESLKGQGRAKNTEFILMPKKNSRGRRLGNLDLDGLGKRPDFINFGKEGVLPKAEPHRVHHNELPPGKL